MAADRVVRVRQGWIKDEMYPFNGRHFDFQFVPMRFTDKGKVEPVILTLGQPFRPRHSRGALAESRYWAPGHPGLGSAGYPGLALPGPYQFIHQTEAHSGNIAGFTKIFAPLLRSPRNLTHRLEEPGTWQTESVNCEPRTLPRFGHSQAEEAPNSVSHPVARFMRGNCTVGAGSGRNHG